MIKISDSVRVAVPRNCVPAWRSTDPIKRIYGWNVVPKIAIIVILCLCSARNPSRIIVDPNVPPNKVSACCAAGPRIYDIAPLARIRTENVLFPTVEIIPISFCKFFSFVIIAGHSDPPVITRSGKSKVCIDGLSARFAGS